MKIQIQDLGEPELEFGGGERSSDPKQILPKAGPFDSTFESGTKTIPLGLVALPSQVDSVRRWIERSYTTRTTLSKPSLTALCLASMTSCWQKQVITLKLHGY